MNYVCKTSPLASTPQEKAKYWCAYCRKRFTYCTFPASSSRPHCPNCDALVQEFPAFLLTSSSSYTNTIAHSSPSSDTTSFSSLYDFNKTSRDSVDGLSHTQRSSNEESANQQDTQKHKASRVSWFFTKVANFFFEGPIFPAFGLTPVNFDQNTDGTCPQKDTLSISSFFDQDASKKIEETKFVCTSKNKGLSCTICYEDYKHNETISKLPCRHEYHKQCLGNWLAKQKSCPMCRQQI